MIIKHLYDDNKEVKYEQRVYHLEYWNSHERGVKLGETRIFNDILHTAWSIERRRWPFKDTVRWKPVLDKHIKIGNLRNLGLEKEERN